MRNTSVFFLLSFSLWACTPEPLLIDIDQAEPELVVYSQVFGDQTVVVYLAKSFSALALGEEDGDPSQELLEQLLVSDALVTITHAGQTDTLFALAPGIYTSLDIPIVEGDNYTLYARDDDMGKEVSSSTIMQSFVPIDSTLAERSFLGDANDSIAQIDVNYSFLDPAGEQFYVASFFDLEPNTDVLSLSLSSFNETQLLSDQTFVSDTPEPAVTFVGLELDTLFMSLSVISEEYYQFLGQRQRSGGIIDALVGEPVSYVTNINGGLGFFHLSIPAYAQIVVQEE